MSHTHLKDINVLLSHILNKDTICSEYLARPISSMFYRLKNVVS